MFFFLVFCGIASIEGYAAQSSSFARETGRFSLSLYKTVIESKNENLVISPVSIQTALALAYMGADGTTAEQMSRVMHLERERSAVGDSYKALLDHHRQSSAVKIANKIFLDQRNTPRPEFTSLVTEKFYSSAETIDTQQSQQAARSINSWVEEKTNHKIRDLVTADAIYNASSILVNAVYFKAEWLSGFSKPSTYPQKFWISEAEMKEVDMMHQTSDLLYGATDAFKAVNLRYKDTDLSLLVILPQERGALRSLESTIEQMDIKLVLDSLRGEKVRLALPKFKIESQAELKDTLNKMGMTEMFTDNANFTKMSEQRVKVSDVIHKALIEVDEEGTVAAAATAVVTSFLQSFSAAPPPPKEFIADHPFMYLLVDPNGHIFFIGRYVK